MPDHEAIGLEPWKERHVGAAVAKRGESCFVGRISAIKRVIFLQLNEDTF